MCDIILNTFLFVNCIVGFYVVVLQNYIIQILSGKYKICISQIYLKAIHVKLGNKHFKFSKKVCVTLFTINMIVVVIL